MASINNTLNFQRNEASKLSMFKCKEECKDRNLHSQRVIFQTCRGVRPQANSVYLRTYLFLNYSRNAPIVICKINSALFSQDKRYV